MMAKVSVYLPAELYEEVRRRGISVSAVSQKALRRELRQQANADWIERVRTRPSRATAPFDSSSLMRDVRDAFSPGRAG